MEKEINIRNEMLEKVAIALTQDSLQDQYEDEEDVQFCTTNELVPADINVEVDGLGLMTFPVSTAYIQQLISISSKAQFGLREQTVLDENVRNTYEIKSDKLHITINEQCLTSMLNKIRDGLALGENCVLTAHLHNMLIYQPGQFFDMHQDSEKLENMIGTLVVVLPSPHIGGDLIIEHGKQKHVFSSENIDHSNAKCIAFYADCLHKIEKVKYGYRIALTYNLVLKSGEICEIENVNQQLRDVVKCYFNTKAEIKRQIDDYFDIKVEKRPRMLVYFLNHSYTQHSLLWSMLKGTDRANASAFRKVAQELRLIPHLALAEIRHCWSVEDCLYGEYFDDPTVIECHDSEITLSHWIDSNNKKLSFIEYQVNEDEICWTKGTECFEPFNTEYQGYTGNAGNTKDFWYKRAAIVLWHESNQIPINFMLNFDSALNALNLLTSSPGNEKEATEIITEAGEHLYKNVYREDKNDFVILANIAIYIKDKDIAISIIPRFGWKILKTANVIVKLQMLYGIDWCIGLLNNCKIYDRCSITDIYSFVQNFLGDGGASTIVELLLDIQSNALINNNKSPIHRWGEYVRTTDSLAEKMNKFYETLAACAAINNTTVVDKVIEHLISNQEVYPNTNLAELLLKLHDAVPSEYFSNYKQLKSYVVQSIESNLALGMRSNHDWSIDTKLRCKCEHCEVATRFLHSKTEISKIWPIRAEIRRHITNVFYDLNLPVKLSVERTGSPHKLIMVKTELLHQNAKKRFDELKLYQRKLQTDIRT